MSSSPSLVHAVGAQIRLSPAFPARHPPLLPIHQSAPRRWQKPGPWDTSRSSPTPRACLPCVACADGPILSWTASWRVSRPWRRRGGPMCPATRRRVPGGQTGSRRPRKLRRCRCYSDCAVECWASAARSRWRRWRWRSGLRTPAGCVLGSYLEPRAGWHHRHRSSLR